MVLTRCLCLIAVVWMFGLRPTAGIRAGSPAPGRWWGTHESRELRLTARGLFDASEFQRAEAVYQQGYKLAVKNHDRVAAVSFLVGAAGARFGDFRYREAFATYLEARKEAAEAGDLLDQGAIDANLSSLYLQFWDMSSALHAAERAQAVLPFLNKPYFEAPLLVHLGRLHELMGDGLAEGYYARAVEAAREENSPALEAKALDYIGAGRLAAGDVAGAERALVESFRIRGMFDKTELPFSWALLGRLKYAQNEMDAAAMFTDRAIEAAGVVDASFPRYLLIHQRGQIRRARGDAEGALNDFGAAVELASEWQSGIPPSIALLTAANIALQTQVFDDFIDAAAERGDVVGSLVAVAQNRAAGLRESLAIAEGWRKRLSPEYWEVQARLRAETGRLRSAGQRSSSLSDQLSLRLSEMEAEAKMRNFANNAEKFRTQISLIDFQDGLSKVDVLLVFHLGVRASYLWAVTRDGATLHLLPPAGELRPEIEQFRNAVRLGRPDAAGIGASLYRVLFGGLGKKEVGKTAWILSVDDDLFDLPFAALRSGDGGKYVVEEHSLRFISGAMPSLERVRMPERGGFFLGVGDPIYNLADSRLRPALFSGFRAEAAGFDSLNRLPGSGAEVEASARNWTAPGGTSVVFMGAEARRSKFLEAAGRGAAVIHLATHIVIPRGWREQAAIAFGIESREDPHPGLLGIAEIAGMRVPGALVVMNGCDSGTGDIRPGAGLLGLTRAWETAGAAGVIATSWPVTDASGAMFEGFYRDLREWGAAEALRRSQVGMIRSGTWRSAPAYWAAYRLSEGGQ